MRAGLRRVLGFWLGAGAFGVRVARLAGLPGGGHEQEDQTGGLGYVPKRRPFVACRFPRAWVLPFHSLRHCEFRHTKARSKSFANW